VDAGTVARYLWEGWFSIELPEGWDFTEEDGLVSFFRNDAGAVGVLQISGAWRVLADPGDPKEPIQLACDFARSMGWALSEEQISLCTVGGAPASEFNYEDDGESWRVWHVLGANRIARITYNSDKGDFEVERSACEAIVNSFRWEPVSVS
jgi:hypothetical protein